MNEHKESRNEVTLNLNEIIIDLVIIALEKHACEHPKCVAKIICDLPKLCHDLCLLILNYLWRHKCKGYKTQTARICCIHRDSVRNYEKFIEP